MVKLPITPSAEQIDPASLTYLCLVDRVSVSSFSDGILENMGNGHLVAYITSDPSAAEQVLLFRFFDFFDEEKATIVLLSSSKAWLQDDRTLIFPRAESGLWRIDCSDSDDVAFGEIQDVLTYFIKYENRHHMRHTLATVNPVSGKVTKVVANNVHLDREDEEGLLDEQDFMSSLDNEEGHKLPVYMDQNATGNTDPSDIRKVRLLYNSGNALIAGSDWIAQALIFAGKSLARGISSGTQAIDSRLEPNQEPVKLSDEEKRIIEAVYNTTSTVTHLTSGLVDKAVSVAVSGINSMAYDSREMGAREPVENASRHLGVSALQAAVRIVSGAATAATAILASSRDSVVKIVHKKYGEDAKFIAERTLGAASNVADTLVYFDGAGISRRVIMSGVDKFNMDASQSSSRSAEENEVVFENDWLEKENESIDMSYYKSASVDVPFNPNLPVEDDDSQVSDEENVAPEKVETNLDEESVVSEKSVTNPEEVGITSEKIEPSLKEDVVAHQPEKIVNLKEEVVLQESEKMETKPREEVILQEPERVIIPKEEVASHKSEKDKKLDVVHNECEIPKEEHTDAIIQTELVI